jgi:tetratricopeptide (TPR) repeat protein
MRAFGAALAGVGLALASGMPVPAGAAQALAPAATAPATPAPESEGRYDACMRQARETPAEGLKTAQAWDKQGGGAPARHCEAVALLALGKSRQAADLLEKVADEQLKANQPKLAAQLLGQAGQAWLMAGDKDKAFAAQNRGVGLAPDDVDLRVDRGLTRAYQKRYWEALDDFSEAHEQAPQRADIMVLMASAYRYVEAFDLARDLVEQALAIEPNNPDALLERGILRRLANDKTGAKSDWERVVQIAKGTPAADAAQANLKRLASGTDKFPPLQPDQAQPSP